MTRVEPAFLVSTRSVRRGFTKVIEVTITDGVDTWVFDTAESFTIPELKRKFPYFKP